jgi:segregation and condensation protein A
MISNNMIDDIYKVKVENIFEGPMDLLIHLIKKNEVDIYDIPVALITVQYLEYLNWMQAMNIDLAGDFLLMASTLAHIKSRMLLPAHGEENEEEDPRMELTQPLLEYMKMKSAAEELAGRFILGEHIFTRKPGNLEFNSESEETFVQIGLFELVEAFKKILDNTSAGHRVDFTDDQISVKDRIAEIMDIMEKRGSITFLELFSRDSNRSMIVITFLAMLEMVKSALVRVVQNTYTGSIRLFCI